MKNTYSKRTRISTRQFRKFLQIFCMDLNATQIADLMNINRNTANLWINKIRARILLIVENEKMRGATHVQVDETYFRKPKTFFQRFNFHLEEVPVFGCINESGLVYATIVPHACKAHIYPVIFDCCASDATIFTDKSTIYRMLPKLGYNHHTVSHVDNEFSRHENDMYITTNRIEGFWGYMKLRFMKFHGVKRANLELHVAESVWRFNHKHDDIYKLLLKEFRVRPLNVN